MKDIENLHYAVIRVDKSDGTYFPDDTVYFSCSREAIEYAESQKDKKNYKYIVSKQENIYNTV